MAALRISPAFVNVQGLSSASTFRATSLRTRKCAIRCEAEPESKPVVEAKTGIPATPVVPPTPVSSPAPKKYSTKFGDVLAFSGPAPETINGRLAMVGFIAALGVELASGAPLTSQIADVTSISWFLFVTSLFSAASLIPLFQGIRPEAKSSGFFTSTAETWNGRAAMLGLIALAITEYVQGSALV